MRIHSGWMNWRRGVCVSIGSTLAVAICANSLGCNVDPAYERQRAPKGPVVSMADRKPASASADFHATPADAQEVDLVENVVGHRDQYLLNLEQLRDYYREHGYATKEKWADFELQGLRKVKGFRYLLDAEIPNENLRPVSQIPDADQLYEKGLALMKKGASGAPCFYRQTPMIEAIKTFEELIDRYPTSDKVDDAAFYLGEIHKDYFKDQEQIAVRWYERAMEWNPNTPHPVRYEAAVVYDYRLHDRDRALELYHAVISDEPGNWGNTHRAERRIRTLSKEPASAQADAVGVNH
ncbi:MAG: hypothetical protein HY287_03295 [Planctomycetes bacterium]|nr:hypothetical protein [Planctomycetota bacterium]MBI3833337.1 hypothetical protein [Planctomycetota bacterium]